MTPTSPNVPHTYETSNSPTTKAKSRKKRNGRKSKQRKAIIRMKQAGMTTYFDKEGNMLATSGDSSYESVKKRFKDQLSTTTVNLSLGKDTARSGKHGKLLKKPSDIEAAFAALLQAPHVFPSFSGILFVLAVISSYVASVLRNSAFLHQLIFCIKGGTLAAENAVEVMNLLQPIRCYQDRNWRLTLPPHVEAGILHDLGDHTRTASTDPCDYVCLHVKHDFCNVILRGIPLSNIATIIGSGFDRKEASTFSRLLDRSAAFFLGPTPKVEPGEPDKVYTLLGKQLDVIDEDLVNELSAHRKGFAWLLHKFADYTRSCDDYAEQVQQKTTAALKAHKKSGSDIELLQMPLQLLAVWSTLLDWACDKGYISTEQADDSLKEIECALFPTADKPAETSAPTVPAVSTVPALDDPDTILRLVLDYASRHNSRIATGKNMLTAYSKGLLWSSEKGHMALIIPAADIFDELGRFYPKLPPLKDMQQTWTEKYGETLFYCNGDGFPYRYRYPKDSVDVVATLLPALQDYAKRMHMSLPPVLSPLC